MNRDSLYIYTVFDHPRDIPDLYVVKRDEVTATGEVIRDPDYIFTSNSLDVIHKAMRGVGLICLLPQPGDDPVIIETWL